MITEPSYWKSEILNCASILREKVDQRRWNSVSVGHLERMTMSACYGARKLYESGYVDELTFHQMMPLRVHSHLGSQVTTNNWRNLDLHYDLEKSSIEEHRLSFLCNQFVHSFVFIPVLKGRFDRGLKGIAFNSDRSRKNALYYVDVWTLIDALAMIGDGYIGRPTVFEVGTGGELILAEDENR